ncbi:MAG: leucine-rich repeat protein [Lachnospiraceae bacterium]|nr:leucine-rich repeat protein [Lachnospiraceae bacterium]
MNLKNKPKRSIYQPIMGIPVIILLLIIAAFGIQFSLKKHYPERYQKELDIIIKESGQSYRNKETGLEYYILEDENKNKYIKIYGTNGKKQIVKIPETINGLPVTILGEMSFLYNEQVEEVILPDSITAITAFVFSDETKKLKKVTIPASVTDIDDLAFANAANLCKQLTIVTDKGSAAEAYAKKHKIKVEYLP